MKTNQSIKKNVRGTADSNRKEWNPDPKMPNPFKYTKTSLHFRVSPRQHQNPLAVFFISTPQTKMPFRQQPKWCNISTCNENQMPKCPILSSTLKPHYISWHLSINIIIDVQSSSCPLHIPERHVAKDPNGEWHNKSTYAMKTNQHIKTKVREMVDSKLKVMKPISWNVQSSQVH